MRFGYIGGEKSIFKDVYKLPPGSFLKFDYENSYLEIKNYWNINNIKNSKKSIKNTKEKITQQFKNKLLKSVKSRMISDVPIGGFLSGGIDSSVICAMMQHNEDKKIKTFTIGFEENKFDESLDARLISKILNNDHIEVILNKENIISSLDNITEV